MGSAPRGADRLRAAGAVLSSAEAGPHPGSRGPGGGPDPATLAAYDVGASTYADRRRPIDPERARSFSQAAPAGPLLDLGSGPGLWFEHLGRPLVAVDASAPMLHLARTADPDVPLVQALLEDLPFATGSFVGIWANKCLQHVTAAELPMVLADLHRILRSGGRLDLEMFAGTGAFRSDDDLPGRRFTLWTDDKLDDVLVGAGFAPIRPVSPDAGPASGPARLRVSAERIRTLADTVGPDMTLLVCGLNPSLVAADAGVGFVGASNRFWPAMRLAGLTTLDRDAVGLLRRDRIGMTDLVKRATRSADELTVAEFRRGLDRLARLVARTRPGAVCLVGLSGWRVAHDRAARPGWQPDSPLGAPTYVMPSTSGRNAHASLEDLAAHLLRAASP